MSKHVDKRTKEYKDSVNDNVDGNTAEVSEVDALRAEMVEMKEMLKTMGQVTANNAKALKKDKVTTQEQITIVRPREAEMAILRDFLEQFQGHFSYDKDLEGKICLNTIMKPSIDGLNEIIKRESQLHKKAVEVGLYVDDNFKDIKMNNK